jgi:hypothetical protein
MSEIDKVMAEGRALTRSLAVIETGASIADARLSCLVCLEQHVANSVETIAIDCALRKICGLASTTYKDAHLSEAPTSLEEFLLHEGVVRWLEWATNEPSTLMLVEPQGTRSVSVLDRMALTQWIEGVEHLRRGNETEAQRYFRRAVTLGRSYGTPSNPVIQWTYAASFFPELDSNPQDSSPQTVGDL